ncbi:cell division protein FtsL [Bathymodiolus platifrons methanotrophic gill symbiont]|uniref:cell division protein FtsL n=1 Tax=Bathymodiolus platifrons methanotrophic gill symbiont TaxID=113268 RepID=UPI000B41E018|nr:cell division protein FtsL [Bathymodiolus platifrons methanotrophic gill symbiont]MCK5869934.1 cell division protein FtsL [Methyloprofundus sp.]TXK96149.1 cell division protein FtsL [Methylococcaceae bacterium CS4]TXK97769.1 cell division protein FtsL [Methylococcaceae bacterium CS5]TXL00102.1 cell division protein FtsL [Methylococcaceae bacterium HT1]TXL05791.1 cell division protein FtsL [Methylococcaceae bacterium CS1]TXL08141.1 cell division protein FtsL [Methylococcaceae bacterium CS3]
MQRVLVVMLLVVLVGSGLAVIFSKHNSRLVFIEIQKTEQELDRLEIRWERLTLEERMLSEHNRVEKIARKKMSLVELERKAIVYIRF